MKTWPQIILNKLQNIRKTEKFQITPGSLQCLQELIISSECSMMTFTGFSLAVCGSQSLTQFSVLWTKYLPGSCKKLFIPANWNEKCTILSVSTENTRDLGVFCCLFVCLLVFVLFCFTISVVLKKVNCIVCIWKVLSLITPERCYELLCFCLQWYCSIKC